MAVSAGRRVFVAGLVALMCALSLLGAAQPAASAHATDPGRDDGRPPPEPDAFLEVDVEALRDADTTARLEAAMAEAATRGSGDHSTPVEAAVVGGTAVTDPNRWPSIIAFERTDGSQFCGGTVLTARWVLSAAHCFWDDDTDSPDEEWLAQSFVREGVLNLAQGGGGAHAVTRAIFHPATGGDHRGTDIVLIEVGTSMSAPPVALPQQSRETHGFAFPPPSGIPPRDGSLWVAGWGRTTEGGSGTDQLRETDVAYWSDEACAQSYSHVSWGPDLSNEMCAGDDGRDACQGDSGGPLFRIVDNVKWQIGLVSRGEGCGRAHVTTIYTWTPFWYESIREITGYVPPGLGAPVVPGAPIEACPAGGVPAAGFSDTHGNTHRGSIDCVVWHGVAQGTSTTRYSPAATVTRAQMASFIARLVDKTPRPLPDGSAQFTDIAGNVHATSIERLAAAGIVQGVGNGRYAPAQTVTRAQMGSFLARAFEYVEGRSLPVAQTFFTDITGNTHEDNIRRIAGAGFAHGTTPTTYAPANPVLRDQMASFLARMLARFGQDGWLSPAG